MARKRKYSIKPTLSRLHSLLYRYTCWRTASVAKVIITIAVNLRTKPFPAPECNPRTRYDTHTNIKANRCNRLISYSQATTSLLANCNNTILALIMPLRENTTIRKSVVFCHELVVQSQRQTNDTGHRERERDTERHRHNNVYHTSTHK